MADKANHRLTIKRQFDAPLERVWRAWTDPDELKKWWGPRGVTNPICEWEPIPGGTINIVMLAGHELGELAGQKWPMSGVFEEVVPRERLVFKSNAIMNDKPILESLVSVTFEESGSKTTMNLEIEVVMATAEAEGPLAGMKMGWTQSIDKLGELLS
jgi:uncharacterized protein YndB with AHSA1/START domain